MMASTDIGWWKVRNTKTTTNSYTEQQCFAKKTRTNHQTHHNHKKHQSVYPSKGVSYGVILCREVEGEIKYALVRKRVSYGVSSILKGDWKKVYFTEISTEERSLFVKICLLEDGWEDIFMHLWSEWKGSNIVSEEFVKCRDNFVQNREWLLDEFQSSTLIFPNGVWEFPKGRMESSDKSPQQCALRELEEETGIDKKSIRLTDMGEFYERYDTVWLSCYYVGVIRGENCENSVLTGECSILKWCSFEEALELIPSVISERIHTLKSVNSKARWIKRALNS